MLSAEEAACYTEAARARGFDQSDVAAGPKKSWPSLTGAGSRRELAGLGGLGGLGGWGGGDRFAGHVGHV